MEIQKIESDSHDNSPLGEKLSFLQKLSSLGETLAADTPNEGEIETSIAGPRKAGLTVATIVFVFFGGWATLAPIDGAAHAPGIIKVSMHNKVVQHLEGGIVSKIFVRNGDLVEQGDVLLEMDPTQSRAQLEILNAQLLQLAATEARLLAERDQLEAVVFPAFLLSGESNASMEIKAQGQLFKTRRATIESAVGVLEQRVGQLQSRLEGLRAQRESKEKLASSFSEELADFKTLLQEGFTDKQRLRDLERNLAVAQGDAAELTSTIASTDIQVGETRMQIIQTQQQYQTEVATELADVQTNLKDVRERLNATGDVVARTDVRAPMSGRVNEMQVFTEGQVLSPGAPIANIVPTTDDLVIEASVMPIDIDRVHIGQEAIVRLPAFNTKTTPELFGKVVTVSADAIVNQQNGMHYYTARIELTPESVRDLRGIELVPGMPADAFIKTGARTFLQYLMKPLASAANSSIRED